MAIDSSQVRQESRKGRGLAKDILVAVIVAIIR